MAPLVWLACLFIGQPPALYHRPPVATRRLEHFHVA